MDGLLDQLKNEVVSYLIYLINIWGFLQDSTVVVFFMHFCVEGNATQALMIIYFF